MKHCSLLFLLAPLLLVTPVDAQAMRPVRIMVDEDGLYGVSFKDLARLMDPRPLNVERLAISYEGRDVPIEIRGGRDGRFDPGDTILFWGRLREGEGGFGSAYVLKYSRRRVRVRRGETVRPPQVRDEAWRRVILERDELFAAIPTVRQSVIRGRPRSHWYWRRVFAPDDPRGGSSASMASFVAEIHPEPRRKLSGRIMVDLVGPVVEGVEQRVSLNVNGRDLEHKTWTTGLEKRLEWSVPAGIIERKNSIQVRNLSPQPVYAEPDNEMGKERRNALLVDRIIVEVPSLLLGPAGSGDQVVYRVLHKAHDPTGVLAFSALSREPFILYDVGRHTLSTHGVIPSNERKEQIIVCAGISGAKKPSEIALLQPTELHLPGNGADWVAVTTSRFAPIVESLARHRQAQGLKTMVVEARSLYDTFTHGRFDAGAIRKFVRRAWQDWKVKPRYLVLVGDADRDVEGISQKETLPACFVQTDYNGATATDTPFGDVDGDGMPEVSVGRISVRTPLQLVDVIDRIISLEKKPPAGDWRRRLRFIAGEARFNPTVDKLLEGTFRKVISEAVPPGFQVSLTYGNPSSPFYWPATGFRERVVSEFNEGSLVFTYVGHGSPDAFDYVRAGGKRSAIMDKQSVPLINAAGKNPILAIIACWTGEYDNPGRDCIGELLLRRSGGPAAVIASSRISHPYPDALFGRGLAQAFFQKDARLGDVVDRARALMMEHSKGLLAQVAKPFLSDAIDPDLLVKDHLYLYNLFGDPALKIPFAPREITLGLPQPPAPGRRLEIHVNVGEGGGLLRVSLDRTLNDHARALGQPGGSRTSESEIVRQHQRANDVTIVSTEKATEGGSERVFLDLPTLPHGTYHLNAYLTSTTGADAQGTLAIQIGG